MKTIISISLLLLGLTLSAQSPFTYQELISRKSRIDSIGTDTLAVIKELLKAKGDERLNKAWHGYTDRKVQEHYYINQSTRCQQSDYESNQLVAMYLISKLYAGHSFKALHIRLYKEYNGKYNAFANLYSFRDYKERKKDCIFLIKRFNRKEFKDIFQLYIDWFEQVEKVGLAKAREMGLDPLKDTPYKWETDPTNVWWYVHYSKRHKN